MCGGPGLRRAAAHARRYDVLLKADQPVGVYWMRSASQVGPNSLHAVCSEPTARCCTFLTSCADATSVCRGYGQQSAWLHAVCNRLTLL